MHVSHFAQSEMRRTHINLRQASAHQLALRTLFAVLLFLNFVQVSAQTAYAYDPVSAIVAAENGNAARTGQMPGPGPLGPVATKWIADAHYAFKTAPVVADGLVIIGVDDGSMRSFAIDTGLPVWQFLTGEPKLVTSPAYDDGRVFFGATDGNVYALDVNSGIELWRFETRRQWTFSSPAIADEVVYIGFTDGTLYAIDATTGLERWHFKCDVGIWMAPAVVDGAVYVGTHRPLELSDGSLYAIDGQTGVELWRYAPAMRGGFASAPSVADNMLYVTNFFGQVVALDATTGTEIWKYTLGMYSLSTPAAIDGRVFVWGGTGEQVVALDSATGEKLWGVRVGFSITGDVVVASGAVYVSAGGNVIALRALDGSELWRFDQALSGLYTPVVVGGVIYAGSNDGNLYALWSY